ncbi:uncharacterized protein E0L32_000010 [Thyridium curvatum]|uniref:Amidohydrolase-related domain-containing protein n=1 Tax=Thyridium curvatum TaxID=1093900 RepID=A0A507B946_9PEZI|nr:uncharacterized protein E0L32_000010 [Thyridium curvatum]TPX15676.1 hypothetical protein E0L32_000010 [Thyridium curvatum]
MASKTIPIVDSHIHLFPADELDNLAWCKPGNPLAKQHSLEEYRAAAHAGAGPDSPPLRGFVFLETDRKNGGDGTDWSGPLMEIDWLRRIAEGRPRPGQGHAAADAALCLGVVPWAPVHLGPARLAEYLAEAERAAGPAAWRLVKGFRYLLQDKPDGSMLRDELIEGLRLLGRKGFVFDLGIDQHRRGRIQLEEAVEMIDRAHEGVLEGEKCVFVLTRPPHTLDHMCKPDVTIINTADPAFIAWRSAVFTLGKCDHVYMKLSGLFCEMSDAMRARPADEIFMAIQPWLAVVLAAFGPHRIMFGSDWPVCTLDMPRGDGDGDGDGAASPWVKWRDVVRRMCDLASLSEEDQAMIWGGTAARAYGLEID